MKSIFSIKDLHVYYGPIHVIKGVNLDIREEGELVSLIGANGAGKTTIMHCISGLLKARQGQITYRGMDQIGRAHV